MAVLPDKIILKNSSDGDAAIRTAIQAGGTDQIAQGEIVLGLGSGVASLYTLDAAGTVVEIVSGGTSTVSGVSQVNWFSGDVLLAASDITDIRADGDLLFSDVTVFIPGYGPENASPTAAYGSTPGNPGQATNVSCVLFPTQHYGSSTRINDGELGWGGNQTALGTTADWSIEIKVYIPDPSNDAYFLWDGVDEAVDKNMFLWWDATNGMIRFEYYDSNTTSVLSQTLTTTLTAATWTYIEARRSNNNIRVNAYDTVNGSRGNGAAVSASTNVGARPAGSWSIGAVTLNGAIDRASTFYFEDFRITEGSNRGTLSPIPESQYGPSTFKTHGVIQVEGDVLRWNDTDGYWDAAGNYGRAIVSNSAPTTDPSGAGLLEGQFWYDSTSGALYQYYNSAWAAVSSSGGGSSWLDDLLDVNIGIKGTVQTFFAFEGANGSTSTSDAIVGLTPDTWQSTAQISTAQFHGGTSSLYLPDGSSYLFFDDTNPNIGAFDFSADNWTYEAWVYPTVNTSAWGVFSQGSSNSISGTFFLKLSTNAGTSSMKCDWRASDSTYGYISQDAPGGTISLNTWHHVAWVKSDAGLSMFLDGTKLGTSTDLSGKTFNDPAALGTSAFSYIGYSQAVGIGYHDEHRLTSGAALYTEDFTPATLTAGVTDGHVLTYDAATKKWIAAAPSSGGSFAIDDATDVDTTTTPPTNGQYLSWDGSNWVPATAGGSGTVTSVDITPGVGITSTGGPITGSGSITVGLADTAVTPGSYTAANITVDQKGRITAASNGTVSLGIDDLTDVDTTTTAPTNGQVLAWTGSQWVPTDQTGGGGGGGGTGSGVLESTDETQTAASGIIDFVGLGASGIFAEITSSLDAWIVFYPTAALRTADAARAFGTDPALGSGVLAEFYITAGGTVVASPGTTYFNNDTVGQEKIYAAVRDQAGANVNSEIAVKAYARRSFNGFGTNRVTETGTASGGTLDITTLGQAGQLVSVQSSLDAWIVMYGSAADRTADSSRIYADDPLPGSGVQAEFYITAGSTVLVTPGTTYFNHDVSATDAVYFAVRDQAGAAVNSQLTITAYAETSFTGVNGGTFGSG